jgi:hypothetical protein
VEAEVESDGLDDSPLLLGVGEQAEIISAIPIAIDKAKSLRIASSSLRLWGDQ